MYVTIDLNTGKTVVKENKTKNNTKIKAKKMWNTTQLAVLAEAYKLSIPNTGVHNK